MSSYNPQELAALGPYLSEFGVMAPSASSRAAVPVDIGTTISLQAMQQGLVQLGFKGTTGQPLIVDGKWGANTQFALGRYILSQKAKYPSAQAERNVSTVFFMPSGAAQALLTTLNQSARGRELLATKYDLAPAAGMDSNDGQSARGVLRALGIDIPTGYEWNQDVTDAWRYAAKTYGLSDAVQPYAGDKFRALVNTNTRVTLGVKSRAANATPTISMTTVRARLSGAPTPTARPVAVRPATPSTLSTQPSRSGLIDVNIGVAQDLLKALRVPFGIRDGKYGPGTRTAWGNAARARRLAPEFDRSGPLNAWVDPATLAALQAAARTPAAAPKAAPTDGKPTQPSKPGLVVYSVESAQKVLNALGFRLTIDRNFGPLTAAAWARAAATRKLDGAFDRAGPTTAWVAPNTQAALELEVANKSHPATIRTTPASAKTIPTYSTGEVASPQQDAANKIRAMATATLSVKTLQQAMRMANISPGATLGKFGGVRDTGAWDAVTEKMFLPLFGLSETYRPIWTLAFKMLVSSTKRSMKVLPDQANTATQLAKMWVAYVAKQAAAAKATAEPAVGGDPRSLSPTAPAPAPAVPAPAPQQAVVLGPQFTVTGQTPAQPAQPALPASSGSDMPSAPYAPMPSAPLPSADIPSAPIPSASADAPAPSGGGSQLVPDPSLSPSSSSSGSSVGIVLGILGVGALAILAMNQDGMGKPPQVARGR